MRTLFLAAAGSLLVAYPAHAQSVDLADVLAANASCASVADARASLERAIAQTSPDTGREAIVSALRQVADRGDLCTELKEAAGTFADQAVADSVAKTDDVSSASTSIVAATLAEAERRAANLKFDVAPPPRFMTKERISRP